jgi:hypothetical protein
MLGDVKHGPVWVAHEKAAQAPVLLGQRVNDFGSRLTSPLIDSVEIVDFDRHIRMNIRCGIHLHHTQLNFALICPEEKDPIQTLALDKPEQASVEIAAFLKTVRADVRLDPLNRHRRSVKRESAGALSGTAG